MQKIGNIPNTRADNNGEFTDGNVAGGVPPTILPAEWFNTIQRELISVLSAAGITPDSNKFDQVSKAVSKLITDGGFLKTANNLSEIKTAGAAAIAQTLLNLGIEEAAKRAVGNSANQIPDMSFFASSQELSGWEQLPNGNIRQWGTVVASINDTDYRNFPIPFPNKCFVIVAGYSDFSSYGFGCAAAPTSKSQFIVSSRNSSGTLSNAKVSFIAEGY